MKEDHQLDWKKNRNKMKFKVNNCYNLDSMSLTRTWQIFKLTVIKLYKTNSSIANQFSTNSSAK